jgi:hypothetical protein
LKGTSSRWAAQRKKLRQPERISAMPRALRPAPCICAAKRRICEGCSVKAPGCRLRKLCSLIRSSAYSVCVRSARRFCTRTCSR